MSVDVTACTMYGKEFDSFSDAIDFLEGAGILNEADAEQSIDCGEFCTQDGNLPANLDYQTYSHYSGHGGILGVQITVREALEKHSEVCNWMDKMTALLGPGCRLHTFCQRH